MSITPLMFTALVVAWSATPLMAGTLLLYSKEPWMRLEGLLKI